MVIATSSILRNRINQYALKLQMYIFIGIVLSINI
jgi:hypothetical protein